MCILYVRHQYVIIKNILVNQYNCVTFTIYNNIYQRLYLSIFSSQLPFHKRRERERSRVRVEGQWPSVCPSPAQTTRSPTSRPPAGRTGPGCVHIGMPTRRCFHLHRLVTPPGNNSLITDMFY